MEKVGEDFKPSFGDIFYSPYFKSDCVVIEYDNPRDWTFVVKNNPVRILRAQSPPSKFEWVSK